MRESAHTCKVKVMRKKVSLFLIAILLVVLAISMVACNKGAQDAGKLPDSINPSDIIETGGDDGPMTAQLKFSFPKGVTSVFKSMFVDEFDISDVEYCVVYLNTQTNATTEGIHGNLTENMLQTDEDRANVKRAGHHQIKVQVETGKDDDGNAVYAKGSFALHLQDRLAPVERVTLTFNLMDGERRANAAFGTTSQNGQTVSVSVDSGVSIASWDEFISTFRMTIEDEGEGKPARALESVSVKGATYSAMSKNFPLTIDNSFNNQTFSTKWTNDTVNVKFNLAVPSDAQLESGKVNPSENPDFKSTQTVRRSYGKAVAPATDIFNVYSGYYFAGWYLDNGTKAGEWDENDTLWNFAKTVGTSDITLVARWTMRVYSYTLYMMGGEFKNDVQNAKADDGTEISSDEIAAAKGFTVVNATSTFGIESEKLNRIDFSGFAYNHNYSEYVAKITVSPQKRDGTQAKSVYVRISQIKDLLVKGNGEYVKFDGIYNDYQCQTLSNMTTVDGTSEKGYVKWVFNDTENAQERLARLSAYYTEVVFKGGLSVKADGSVCIDKIADESVSELIIPAELTYLGATRPVSEISAKACMNLKALTKLDFSEASNLQIIGEQAFAHAPNLRNIVPITDDKKMESVGKNVFYGSEFENNYFKNNNGKQFIVIGKVLYKFVGQEYNDGENTTVRADLVKSLDLSGDYYPAEIPNAEALNTQLKAVTIIANGAFANALSLKSISLGDNVQKIENGAFANLENFATVNVGATSKLAYVGESAFSGTSMLKETSGNYNSGYKAIVIGKVYYRFIDNEATSTHILGDIDHIAPHAFVGCANLTSINLANCKPLSVGKGAFTSTKWIKDATVHANGLVVIEGASEKFLVEYFDDGKGTKNVVVPSQVTSIGEEAFYQYANTVKTIKFDKNLKYIGNYAFKGASAMESFIFTDVVFETNKLVGAPYIESNAFADENNKLVNNAKFYLTKSVLDALDKINNNQIETDDKTTLAWAQLYRLNKANFVEEKVDKVYINTDVVKTLLLKTETDKDAFETDCFKGSNIIPSGLIVRNNTGVDIVKNLEKTGNNVKVITVTQGDEKYGSLYEEGVTKYVVTFTYNNSTDGCQINIGDEHLYVATVYNAIKGNPSFYEEGNSVPTINVTGTGNYYLKGFEGKQEGADIPLFYTSYKAGEGKFVYTDIDGVQHELDIDRIENFITTRTTAEAEAVVTVNFHNIGTYKFKFKYAVEISQVEQLEQDGAISIPLNSNVASAFAKFKVRLIGQDGSVTLKSLSTSNGFTLVDGASVDTKTLGIHTLRVKYAADDVLGGVIEIPIVYFVVLEADASLFEYEIADTQTVELGGETFAGKVRIVSCKASSAETIVLPSIWTAANGDKYIVSEIGKNDSSTGVFENFKNLKAVYLGANIDKINARAFANCVVLENVYTAQNVNAEYAVLSDANFAKELVSESETEIVYNATVSNLEGVEYDRVLAIGGQYTVDGAKKVVYNVVGISALQVKDGTEVFLPDTLTKEASLTYENGAPVTANVYSSNSNVMFRTLKYVNGKVEYVGNGAFTNTSALKGIDLSHATELHYVGANAFAGSGLVSIDLSANTKLVEINQSVFAGCTKLATATLSNTVTTIADHAFYNCSALTEILGVTQVKNLAQNAYEGCNALVTKPSKAA